MPKLFDIAKFNLALASHGQVLKAETITGKLISLSNGLHLTTERDIRLCKKRVMGGHVTWKANFDLLYNINKNIRIDAEKKCRSDTSRLGGSNCWLANKSKIKLNLNTGVPHNKGKKSKYPSWNKGLTKENNESLARLSESRKGKGNPMFGKHQTEENKLKSSLRVKDAILNGTL